MAGLKAGFTPCAKPKQYIMNKTKMTPRVERLSEYCSEYTRQIFLLDGKEVLHFCKTFYYDSNPYYSRVNSCGEYRPQISKEEFNAELKRIMELN